MQFNKCTFQITFQYEMFCADVAAETEKQNITLYAFVSNYSCKHHFYSPMHASSYPLWKKSTYAV